MTWNYSWTEDGDDFHPVPPAVARHLCRLEFVVESYEVIGS